MKKRSYLVKIIPPVGYRIYRLEFTRQHVLFGVMLALSIAGGVAGYYLANLRNAEVRVGELRATARTQLEQLTRIDAQAAELDDEFRKLELQNRELRKMIGAPASAVAPATAAAPNAAPTGTTAVVPAAPDRERTRMRADAFTTVDEHFEHLRADSMRVSSEGADLRDLALHMLNMRRLEDIARARILASIPSLNPRGSAKIASPFGWRIDPWPSYHQGVDLEGDYGDPIWASAAGVVVSAGYDGGYGNKIDIDHGNGYHTYYAHLSKFDVVVGQHVIKSQLIGEVGATGDATGPHLHYQVMLGGRAIDPTPYLTGVPERVLASLK